MIHPNRTYLLQQKEKRQTIENSLHVLKARRQALISEFLNSARPLLASRRQLAARYQKAIEELQLSIAQSGREQVAALAATAESDLGLEVAGKSILGVLYREITASQSVRRKADARGYDLGGTSPHLEEAIEHFEIILEIMLQVAGYENKLKRLSSCIRRITRQYRVLEQRILPDLNREIKKAGQYINERAREDHYRLKRFKELKKADGGGNPR